MTRTVVVTGGAGAIGGHVMARFAQAGDRVIGLDTETAATSDPGTLAGNGEDPEIGTVVGCDITSEDDVHRAFTTVRSRVGPVDVLVNAAGVTGSGRMADETPDRWRHIIDVNLTGAFLCCREALTDMTGSGSGCIVNVASVNARFGGSALSGPAYAASKGGLVTLTRFIAREHATDGVRANAVAPGPHDTPMWQALDEERRAAILATLPGGGIGEAADLAALVHFLCGDAARYVNGATIDVNGGQWMG